MCVFWVRGAPDGRKGRAMYMCERESGVFLSVKNLGCSGLMIEKCTHGTPLTLGNHKTLSCGHKYSPCLPLSHTQIKNRDVKELGQVRDWISLHIVIEG